MSVKSVYGGGVLIIVGLMLAVSPAVAGDESDMEGRIAAWVEAYNTDNLEAIVALYSEDACRMPPNLEEVHGSEAILAQLTAGKEAGGAKVEIGLTSASTSGDMGWGEGTFVLLADDGAEIDHGKWLNVSKKIDGNWKIQCDIWNSNVPLEGSE